MQFDNADIFAALHQLQPTNEAEVRFLRDLPDNGLYDVYWEKRRG